MKAIVRHKYGPPDVLELGDIDKPELADDEVLLRVRATSVNSADWHLLRGEPYIARVQLGLRKPKDRVLGCDVAGRVEAVGKNVTMLERGGEVFGSPFMHGLGAFAERVRIGDPGSRDPDPRGSSSKLITGFHASPDSSPCHTLRSAG
jgi:NADPH:quinone reductase-like Zn-dependent oxidoreductase